MRPRVNCIVDPALCVCGCVYCGTWKSFPYSACASLARFPFFALLYFCFVYFSVVLCLGMSVSVYVCKCVCRQGGTTVADCLRRPGRPGKQISLYAHFKEMLAVFRCVREFNGPNVYVQVCVCKHYAYLILLFQFGYLPYFSFSALFYYERMHASVLHILR